MFKKIKEFFKTVFGLFNTKDKTTEQLDKIILLVDKIKRYANKPIFTIISKLTPTDIDDIALEFVKATLEKAEKKFKDLKKDASIKSIAGELASKKTGLPIEVASVKIQERYKEIKSQEQMFI